MTWCEMWHFAAQASLACCFRSAHEGCIHDRPSHGHTAESLLAINSTMWSQPSTLLYLRLGGTNVRLGCEPTEYRPAGSESTVHVTCASSADRRACKYAAVNAAPCDINPRRACQARDSRRQYRKCASCRVRAACKVAFLDSLAGPPTVELRSAASVTRA